MGFFRRLVGPAVSSAWLVRGRCLGASVSLFSAAHGHHALCMEDAPATTGNWRHRWPGQFRSDRGVERKSAMSLPHPALGVTGRAATEHGLRLGRAAQPALLALPLPAPPAGSRAAADVPSKKDTDGMALRLAAGRDVQNLLGVMSARLIGQRQLATNAPLEPARGLFATMNGDAVYIMSVFTRHKVPCADVIPLRPGKKPRTSVARLCDAVTVPRHQLENVGVGYRFAQGPTRSSTSLTFQAMEENQVAPALDEVSRHMALARYSSPLSSTGAACFVPTDNGNNDVARYEPRRIIPGLLLEHLEECRSRGEEHLVAPRYDRGGPGYVLDLPLPWVFDDRPHECRTCRGPSHRVVRADVERVFPGVLSLAVGKRRTLYMTPRFLVHIVLSFYDVLNLRETKRKLVELYSSNALSSGTDALAWSTAAVPRVKNLQKILRTALRHFLEDVVADFQARLIRYSASGVRGDGHHDIARRIVTRTAGQRFPDRPYTVVLAWCGVDGCLLKPPTPSGAEAFTDIQADLEPLLELIRTVRLQAGLSLMESAPVFHSTDSFRKHRKELDALYRRLWPELAMATRSATPKGDAIEVVRDKSARSPTAIVGEPIHTVLKARRLSSVTSNDCADFHFDMQFWADRLSAPMPDADEDVAPSELPVGMARQMLRDAALLPSLEAEERLREAPQDVKQALTAFIKQPAVEKSQTWVAVFGTRPGRATIARIARRLGAKTHPSMGMVNYRTLRECWRALKTLQAWYRPGRKQTRRRRGIFRVHAASDRVRGRQTVEQEAAEVLPLPAPE